MDIGRRLWVVFHQALNCQKVWSGKKGRDAVQCHSTAPLSTWERIDTIRPVDKRGSIEECQNSKSFA